jgi:hypothetical protein
MSMSGWWHIKLRVYRMRLFYFIFLKKKKSFGEALFETLKCSKRKLRSKTIVKELLFINR